MPTSEDLLNLGRERAVARGLPYDGALTPAEARALLQATPGSVLIDVRTRAEWDYVGRIPDSVEVEWQTYPGGQPNPQFLEQLQARVQKNALLLFICRSGARSHAAAAAAKSVGFRQCINVLEGFEGDKNSQGQRNAVGGWRHAGLPWYQS